MSQPLLGGGQGYGVPPFGFGYQPQPSNQITNASNHGPLPIESLGEFYLGAREDLRVTVT